MACSGWFPGRRRSFWRRSMCATSPEWARSWSRTCTRWESTRSATSARLDEDVLEERFGKWGLALAGKARGEDAGGWFDTEVGEDTDPKSISHEHTFNEDTANPEQLESTLMRLSEMVAPPPARARPACAHHPTQTALQRFHHHYPRALARRAHAARYRNVRADSRTLFRKNWKKGAEVRLLGVHVSSFEEGRPDS